MENKSRRIGFTNPFRDYSVIEVKSEEHTEFEPKGLVSSADFNRSPNSRTALGVIHLDDKHSTSPLFEPEPSGATFISQGDLSTEKSVHANLHDPTNQTLSGQLAGINQEGIPPGGRRFSVFGPSVDKELSSPVQTKRVDHATRLDQRRKCEEIINRSTIQGIPMKEMLGGQVLDEELMNDPDKLLAFISDLENDPNLRTPRKNDIVDALKREGIPIGELQKTLPPLDELDISVVKNLFGFIPEAGDHRWHTANMALRVLHEIKDETRSFTKSQLDNARRGVYLDETSSNGRFLTSSSPSGVIRTARAIKNLSYGYTLSNIWDIVYKPLLDMSQEPETTLPDDMVLLFGRDIKLLDFVVADDNGKKNRERNLITPCPEALYKIVACRKGDNKPNYYGRVGFNIHEVNEGNNGDRRTILSVTNVQGARHEFVGDFDRERFAQVAGAPLLNFLVEQVKLFAKELQNQGYNVDLRGLANPFPGTIRSTSGRIRQLEHNYNKIFQNTGIPPYKYEWGD